MTTLASFRINQGVSLGSYDVARRDIEPTSSAGEVTFEAYNPSLVYVWEVTQPPGSSVTIGSSTSQTATFAAEVDGGYIVKLTVNPGSPDEDVSTLYFGIATDINGTGFCLPSLNETIQDNSLGHPEWGWWEKMYSFLRELASFAGSGGSADTFFEAGSSGTDSIQRIDFGVATGDYSWALGSGSTANGAGSWSIGNSSSADGDLAIAFGDQSYATGYASMALGQAVTTKDFSGVFGYGYINAIHCSLAVGFNTSGLDTVDNPQTMRIPVGGRTQPNGTPSRLYIDWATAKEIGPVPEFSYMNIALHLVAKSDDSMGGTPALVTFDGTIQAISSASDITYQDWTIEKTISTSVYEEELWEVSLPTSTASLDYLEFIIVQDSNHANEDVIWTGYIDIAYVATRSGGGPM